MEIPIGKFIEHRKKYLDQSIRITFMLGDKLVDFAGDCRDVYENLKNLSEETIIPQDTILTLTYLDKSLLAEGISWLDEIPGLLESIRFKLEKLKLQKFEDRISAYYSDMYIQIEKLIVAIEQYLDGKIDKPPVDICRKAIERLRLIESDPLLLKAPWFGAIFKPSEYPIEEVELLLWAGKNPDTELTTNGLTALYFAGVNNNIELLKLLLSYGASTNNKSGKLIFQMACNNNLVDVVKCLLDNGVDPQTIFDDGLHALTTACKYENLEIVKLLLEYGADPNIFTYPLHIASAGNNVEIVKLLLKYGVNVNTRNDVGVTPLRVATTFKRKDIIRFLKNEGARL